MRSSTVSAPVQSCVFGLSAPNARYAAVQLLTNQFLYFIVEPKSRTRELFVETCRHLAASGMQDTELFGLATASDGEYLFADLDYKLSKYAPKNWRSSSTNGLDSNGKPLLILHFRVKFYLESPLLLRDDTSRHHYYRQLRDNVVARGLVHACASEEVLYLLAGLALQADYGDYSALPANNTQAYFKPSDYLPQQVCMVSSGSEARLVQTASSLHRAYRGLSQTEAENQFIREASSSDTSPLTHNSHLYRLKQRKHDPGPGSVLLAICTWGIELYQENSTKALSGTFLWNDIGKLCFDRKKFEIRALNWPTSGEKLTYYTNNDEKAKHLLALCRESHQFSMALAPRLGDIRRKEEEERKRYRDWGLSSSVVCHRGDQRISVISSTSSNTTSGIVSDRVHSLDESEDDLELEIMINNPPAPVVESLALAHLQERVNASAPTSPPTPPSGGGDCVDGCGAVVAKPGGATTPATTDGSQCSSSCSTVVVAATGTTVEPITSKRLVSNRGRRASTSSSLELGYSHTAQNSAMSDTSVTASLELDYSVQSAHTSSGVYTLRSSTATHTNTLAGSSQTSGIVLDQSEGQRTRSGSLVSQSGSFHGDGSDPSDAGRGALLSAEELSDLIVGRSPKPRRGMYPSRATVSSTLDSDSDYVTLPPPPLPPPRSDSERPTSTYGILELASALSSPEETLASPLRLDDSLSNLSLSSRKSMEELFLQQQIQFQHLASSFSPQKQQFSASQPQLSTTGTKAAVSTSSTAVQTSDLDQYLSQPLIVQSPTAQYQPQYALQSQSSPKSPTNYSPLSNLPSPTEEASARFISTKPHINVLTAHTSLVASTAAAPNFAAPTVAYQSSVPTYTSPQRNYLPDTRSYPLDPSSRMKIKHPSTQNLIPIVGSNNYLDVRGSGAAFLQHFHQKFPPPPPVIHPRQPPPPPPPPPPRSALQTVYTSQVTRSQIEQFKQQMYSDVDYVIYPMKDPAISKQEYMDSKIALGHYNQVYPPPPYPSYSGKSHMVYRSTPNVAVASGYIPVSFKNPSIPSQLKYASNQNLSSDFAAFHGSSFSFLNHYPSSTSPLYSAAASYSSSSTQSLRYDPFSVQMSVPKLVSPILSTGSFTRTQSDDNILNSAYEKPSLERTRMRRPPPPLPPSYVAPREDSHKKKLPSVIPVTSTTKPARPAPTPLVTKAAGEEERDKSSSAKADGLLDIRTLREKSRNMDLPLISALCNDRSLLKQTNAFVLPRHPGDGRPVSWHMETNTTAATETNSPKKSLLSSLLSSKSGESTSPIKHSYSTASKVKYPVSGLSTTQIVKPARKTSRHTHPQETKISRSKSTSSATTSSANLTDTILPQ